MVQNKRYNAKRENVIKNLNDTKNGENRYNRSLTVKTTDSKESRRYKIRGTIQNAKIHDKKITKTGTIEASLYIRPGTKKLG